MNDHNIAVDAVEKPGIYDGAERLCRKPAVRSLPVVEMVKWAVSFPTLLGTCLVGAAFYTARLFFVDPDVWWHIRNGQDILATYHWPTTDPSSFTVHGQPWIAFEWLGDVLLSMV